MPFGRCFCRRRQSKRCMHGRHFFQRYSADRHCRHVLSHESSVRVANVANRKAVKQSWIPNSDSHSKPPMPWSFVTVGAECPNLVAGTFLLFCLDSPTQRRHINCNDSPGPGSNSTTSVRPEVKFVPWKSSRSNIQLASASTVNPPPSVLSNPTAARWSKT